MKREWLLLVDACIDGAIFILSSEEEDVKKLSIAKNELHKYIAEHEKEAGTETLN